MTDVMAPEAAPQVAQAQEPSTVTEVKTDSPPEEGQGDKPEITLEEAKKELERQNRKIARQTAANKDIQRQLQEDRRLREAAEARIREYEAKVNPLADKPNPDNYDTTEDYAEALADWKLNQKQAEANKPKGPSVEDQVKQQVEFEKKALDFRSKEDAYRQSTPDYDKNATVLNAMTAGLNPQHPSTIAFSTALFRYENPPEIINYLGSNPAEVASMMKMTPFEITEKMGEIIDQLTDAKPAVSAAPVPAALPQPPSAIKGSNAKVAKSFDDMTGRELLNKIMPKGR